MTDGVAEHHGSDTCAMAQASVPTTMSCTDSGRRSTQLRAAPMSIDRSSRSDPPSSMTIADRMSVSDRRPSCPHEKTCPDRLGRLVIDQTADATACRPITARCSKHSPDLKSQTLRVPSRHPPTTMFSSTRAQSDVSSLSHAAVMTGSQLLGERISHSATRFEIPPVTTVVGLENATARSDPQLADHFETIDPDSNELMARPPSTATLQIRSRRFSNASMDVIGPA